MASVSVVKTDFILLTAVIPTSISIKIMQCSLVHYSLNIIQSKSAAITYV